MLYASPGETLVNGVARLRTIECVVSHVRALLKPFYYISSRGPSIVPVG